VDDEHNLSLDHSGSSSVRARRIVAELAWRRGRCTSSAQRWLVKSTAGKPARPPRATNFSPNIPNFLHNNTSGKLKLSDIERTRTQASRSYGLHHQASTYAAPA
jgi:hypothetical protein